MAVRVIRAGKVSYPPTSQVFRLNVGDVHGGDFGAFLAENARKLVEAVPDQPVATPSGRDATGGGEDDGRAGSEEGPEDAAAPEAPGGEGDAAGPAVLTRPVDPAGGIPDGFDPADHTVDDVMAWVDTHPEWRAVVRQVELEGRARTTLLTRLAD